MKMVCSPRWAPRRLAEPGILKRVAVFVDAPHPGCGIADELLGPDDEHHQARPRHERA